MAMTPDWDAEAWGAFGTVVSAALALAVVVLTFVSVRHNGRMVAEMKATREAASKPLILLTFVRSPSADIKPTDYIYLQIGNYGGPAANVSFSFNPILTNHVEINIEPNPTLARPIPLLLPDEVRTVPFADWSLFFGAPYYQGKRVTQFCVTIRSFDPESLAPFDDSTIWLDLAMLAPFGFNSDDVYLTPYPVLPDWQLAHSPTPDEAARLSAAKDQILNAGIGEQVLIDDGNVWGDPFHELRILGWQADANPLLVVSARVIAVRFRPPHQGAVVLAGGWTRHVAALFALAKAVELDQQWPSD